mgnify:FL=1
MLPSQAFLTWERVGDITKPDPLWDLGEFIEGSRNDNGIHEDFEKWARNAKKQLWHAVRNDGEL